MTDILRGKLRQLVYGEDGVALVVTLALFMFLYVSCAGVFAIGRTVKERVLLQNAADAAAYSAAVVQADTLSRIATINRAMAWTYKDMVQLQHDYVILSWLEETFDRYSKDKDSNERVYAKVDGSNRNGITLNEGTENETVMSETDIADIGKILEKLREIEGQIYEDKCRLKAMYDEECSLIESFVASEDSDGRDVGVAKATVRRILEANLSGEYGKRCLHKLKISGDWWEILEDEFQFLDFNGGSISVEEKWFSGIPGKGKPICHFYKRDMDDYEATWYCQKKFPTSPILPSVRSPVKSKDVPRDYVAEGGPDDDYTAKPIVVNKNYFPSEGAQGVISVCVAHRTENPWKFGSSTPNGLYDAFNPFSEHTRWARAVSSAQAGYRDGGEGVYSVRWDDSKIGTNDWDAVFVPVRKAFTANAFREMIQPGDEWDKVLDSGYDDLVSNYEVSVNDGTLLPMMHNDARSDGRLEWDADGEHSFLDLMFH